MIPGRSFYFVEHPLPAPMVAVRLSTSSNFPLVSIATQIVRPRLVTLPHFAKRRGASGISPSVKDITMDIVAGMEVSSSLRSGENV